MVDHVHGCGSGRDAGGKFGQGGRELMAKKWYQSKTLWSNLVAAAAIFVSSNFGIELTAEETGAALVLINIVLRLVTKQPLGL